MKKFKSTNETIRFSAPTMKLNYGEYNNGELPIKGYAVHEGLFKNIVEIPKSELPNVAKTLTNAQLRVDHSFKVRDIVGLVGDTRVEYHKDAQKEGVQYKAFVDDEKIAEGVLKNKIRDVSIGFDFDPECSKCGEDFRDCEHWFDVAHIIARNVEAEELSLVTRGADPDANVVTAEITEQFSDKTLTKKGIKKEPQTNEGGSFMGKDDKTIDVVALTDKVSEAQKQALAAEAAQKKAEEALEAIRAEKAQLEADKEKLKTEKEEIESEKTVLEGKFTEVSGALTKQELEAKEEEATEIAQLKVEKGLIKQEELDADVESMMKLDSLDEIKDLVTKFEAKTKKDKKVPEIQKFEKFVSEDGNIDYDDPKVEQAMIHEIFAYDRVFSGKPGDEVVEGKSYMGLTLHK